MGYYSDFYLTVTKAADEDGTATLEDVAREIEKLDVLESGNTEGSYWFCNDIKWYESDDDMSKIAKMFPEFLFELERYGENRDDFDRTYYQGDRSHICHGVMEFEPFDVGAWIKVDTPSPEPSAREIEDLLE